ncbi:hypothetical protein C0J52_14537 [Blattella germanica]|nr:hypothetical protein C0J52_14537 [Blattella germanica]
MKDRMEREDCLLDDDEDNSSITSEPGECKWMILSGVFIIQLVFSGVLASYGVFLLQFSEEGEIGLQTAFWTPVIFITSWCFLDPLWKRLLTTEKKHSARLLASIGVLITAGGIAASALSHIPGLQMLLYGLIGGIGTSLVLMQADVTLCCHYSPHSYNAFLPQCIPQLGKALAHFAMPLLIHTFTTQFGFQMTPILQSGIILQAILGSVTLIPPDEPPPSESRYRSRPRAFTFVENEMQSIINRDNYVNNSYYNENSLNSGRTWKNPSSSVEECEDSKTTSEPNQPSPRCNRNHCGVDILPEIPEESEDESDYNTSMDFSQNKRKSLGAKSMDDVISNTSQEFEENKRWSVGIVEEVVPIKVENGLADIWDLVKNVESESESERMSVNTLDEHEPRKLSIGPPIGDVLSSTKSLGHVNLSSDSRQINKFEKEAQNKVRSVDYIAMVHTPPHNYRSISGNIDTNNSGTSYSFDELLSVKEETERIAIDREVSVQIADLKQNSEGKQGRNRWSIGTVDEIISVSNKSNVRDEYTKQWHSAEFIANGFQIELKDLNKVQESEEVECLTPGSTGSDRPLWPNKDTSIKQRNSYSFRHRTGIHTLRKLISSVCCRCYQPRIFRKKYPQTKCGAMLWPFFFPIPVPYIFPSLLMRLTLRLCPMGFAALTPSFVKHLLVDCSNKDAVFPVSVAGFVWLCYLLVTPWCTKLRPRTRKCLFALGNFVAAFGLHFLSKADSHDRVTLGCAIFGLGNGITAVTGSAVMREALGTWNLAKVGIILDIGSGILVLASASIMGVLLQNAEGLARCFILMAVLYLVTGATWLLRPLLASLQCHHHAHSDWSSHGGHLLSTG